MDKFVVSLPRGNGQKRKNSTTNLGSASKKLALTRVGKIHRSVTGSSVAKPQQIFLDLGQKSFGATEQCLTCAVCSSSRGTWRTRSGTKRSVRKSESQSSESRVRVQSESESEIQRWCQELLIAVKYK